MMKLIFKRIYVAPEDIKLFNILRYYIDEIIELLNTVTIIQIIELYILKY